MHKLLEVEMHKFKSFLEYGMPPKAKAYKTRMDKKYGRLPTSIPQPGTKDFKTVVNKMRKAAGMKTKRKFSESDTQSADKKVQDYIDPNDGKKKVRMVPVDKQIVDKDKDLDK